MKAWLPWSEPDAHHRQRQPVHLGALPRNADRAGIIHRRAAYYHPRGNCYIEHFHRKAEENTRTSGSASTSARYIGEYDYDRPHRSLGNRTPREDLGEKVK